VARRASCTAIEVGQRLRKSQKEHGIFLLKPLQDVREVVFEGTGQTIGETHFVADQATAVLDEVVAKARMVGLWGLRGVSLSRCLRSSSSCEFGIGGSSLARLG